MAAIGYSSPIFIKYYIIAIYMERLRCSEFGYNIFKYNKNELIVCMVAIRYIGPIRLVPTYLQRAAIGNKYVKFH